MREQLITAKSTQEIQLKTSRRRAQTCSIQIYLAKLLHTYRPSLFKGPLEAKGKGKVKLNRASRDETLLLLVVVGKEQ